MSLGAARRFWRPGWAVSGLCCWVFASAGLGGELPPPPSSMEAISDAQLFLELVVNQMNTGRVIAVEQRAGRLFVPVQALRETGMKLPEGSTRRSPSTACKGCTATMTARASACCWKCRRTGCRSN